MTLVKLHDQTSDYPQSSRFWLQPRFIQCSFNLRDCLDKTLYKSRDKIESMFGKLKNWRRIHTRDDRYAHALMSAIAIAVTVTFCITDEP
ncbi:MAG: hypothetical protein ACSHXI_14520 [Hoeflea sp.]|uniref:hypothetical protein n=1 Tax=Hoeflea sp. TaxID=1940281 RepID=UPI003EF68688